MVGTKKKHIDEYTVIRGDIKDWLNWIKSYVEWNIDFGFWLKKKRNVLEMQNINLEERGRMERFVGKGSKRKERSHQLDTKVNEGGTGEWAEFEIKEKKIKKKINEAGVDLKDQARDLVWKRDNIAKKLKQTFSQKGQASKAKTALETKRLLDDFKIDFILQTKSLILCEKKFEEKHREYFAKKKQAGESFERNDRQKFSRSSDSLNAEILEMFKIIEKILGLIVCFIHKFFQVDSSTEVRIDIQHDKKVGGFSGQIEKSEISSESSEITSESSDKGNHAFTSAGIDFDALNKIEEKFVQLSIFKFARFFFSNKKNMHFLSLLPWVAIFHDVGKVKTKQWDETKQDYTFFAHEKISAEAAKKRMQALKFSKEEIKTISHLVRHHMVSYDSSWSDGAVRRFLRKVGDSWDLLLDFVRADIFAETWTSRHRVGNGYCRA